jgi:hypothetical protein
MVLKTDAATHQIPGSLGDSYWNVATFDNFAAEAWGYAFAGGAEGLAWSLGLFQDVGGSGTVDGYRARIESAFSGVNFVLYKYTNAVRTVIASGGSLGSSVNPGWLLVRRNGTDVEVWYGGNASISIPPTSWTLECSATDTTYTTGLSLSLGITDNSGSQLNDWLSFGGGGPSASTLHLLPILGVGA